MGSFFAIFSSFVEGKHDIFHFLFKSFGDMFNLIHIFPLNPLNFDSPLFSYSLNFSFQLQSSLIFLFHLLVQPSKFFLDYLHFLFWLLPFFVWFVYLSELIFKSIDLFLTILELVIQLSDHLFFVG